MGDGKAEFASGDGAPSGVDGTPGWCYDEDGYCIRCGNGRWKPHMPGCELRDLLDHADMEEAERTTRLSASEFPSGMRVGSEKDPYP